MQRASSRVRASAVIGLVALASIATVYAFDYSSTKNIVAGVTIARQLPLALVSPTEQPMVSLHYPVVRHVHVPVAVDAFAVIAPVAAVAAMPRARIVPQQAVTMPPVPYSHAGYIEADGRRLVVLERGDLLISKNQGERVDDEFQLAAVDPPALLHLPSGMLFQVLPRIAEAPVRRPATGAAPPLSSRPVVANAVQPTTSIEMINAAEIETEIAVALATPIPELIVQSSFPLAR